MGQDVRAWEKQFNNNFGSRELLRFLGAVAGWLVLGLLLSRLTGDFVIFFLFMISAFVFPVASMRWKPAYILLHIILGNHNLPVDPWPAAGWGPLRRRAWSSITSGVWLWVMVLFLLYLVIRDLSRLIFRI